VDYAIWSVIQQSEYETRDHDIDGLSQHLMHVVQLGAAAVAD